MRITLRVQQSGEEQYQIGTVMPPTVNNLSVYSAEVVHSVLDSLWAEWREAEPYPDTDSQFVEWLVREKGWQEAETNDEHIFYT